jgi:hypothetical protein
MQGQLVYLFDVFIFRSCVPSDGNFFVPDDRVSLGLFQPRSNKGIFCAANQRDCIRSFDWKAFC